MVVVVVWLLILTADCGLRFLKATRAPCAGRLQARQVAMRYAA